MSTVEMGPLGTPALQHIAHFPATAGKPIASFFTEPAYPGPTYFIRSIYMKTLVRFGIGLCCTIGLSFGLTWYRGQLMDASCYNQNQNNMAGKIWVKCAPTASTTTFAIHANGKVRMLDDAGNAKAMAAFKPNFC